MSRRRRAQEIDSGSLLRLRHTWMMSNSTFFQRKLALALLIVLLDPRIG